MREGPDTNCCSQFHPGWHYNANVFGFRRGPGFNMKSVSVFIREAPGHTPVPVSRTGIPGQETALHQ